MEKVNMDSLVTVLATIEKRGFTCQFGINGNNLVSLQTGFRSQPQEVKIVHFYRFEGDSNPDDSSIMYAIECANGEKGTLVDGYSNTSDPDIGNFICNVKDIQK